ncbi:MAG TPA: hypothetical protein PKO15_02245 [Fibrobacteria bacterium]|nr:hypothetical protein [Fibrobacteria bacterium]HOX51774.1 hypothetical protein [Fibrobacteria bacterium]
MNATALVLAGLANLFASPLDLPLGGSDFKLLKAPAGPVSQAFSQGGVSRSDLAGNPAVDSVSSTWIGIGWMESYTKFEGSGQEAVWQAPMGRWSFLGHARYEGFDGLEGRSETDRPTGDYSAYTWALEGGASVRLPWQGWQLGAMLGGGMEAVSNASAYAGWGSMGLRVAEPSRPWAFGVVASNLGLAGSDRSWVDLPAVIQGGGSWAFRLERWTLVPMADVRWVADEDIVFPVAFEARWEGARLRTGFPVGRPEAAPSFGAGWTSDSWAIDLGLGWHTALGLAPSGRLSLCL